MCGFGQGRGEADDQVCNTNMRSRRSSSSKIVFPIPENPVVDDIICCVKDPRLYQSSISIVALQLDVIN